jgi:uncharacterized protein (DUF302 family)
MPDNGIVSVQSRFSANETIERLLAILTERGITVFARVDPLPVRPPSACHCEQPDL